jgi:hypothetical protein
VARDRSLRLADDLPVRCVLDVDQRDANGQRGLHLRADVDAGSAAIISCRILGRPLRPLGLGTWNGRFVLIGYLVPIAYCLVASLGIWLLGFGGFPNTDFY